MTQKTHLADLVSEWWSGALRPPVQKVNTDAQTGMPRLVTLDNILILQTAINVEIEFITSSIGIELSGVPLCPTLCGVFSHKVRDVDAISVLNFARAQDMEANIQMSLSLAVLFAFSFSSWFEL